MDDLRIIKKRYGEAMMRLCRSLFSTLLEEPGVLSKLMLDHFEPSRDLYSAIVDSGIEFTFKDYIYSLVEDKNETKFGDIDKTPEELLKEVGYTLFECKSEEEIQSFRKYYRENEALCTFWTNRLERFKVFFAVKDDVDEIKREDFKKPRRQDRYGTSVISIQFTKDDSHTLSIKNRYNHSVDQPDATFSNDLDNINAGLTESFEKYYGMKQKHYFNGFNLENYVKANDGKYYKYNYEINNVYYCPNNVIIDNFEVKKYDAQEVIVLDYFLLDLKSKRLSLYDKRINDHFVDGFINIKNVKRVNKKGGSKEIFITLENMEDIIIEIDSNNKIKKLYDPNIEKVKDNFLYYNKDMEIVELSNAKELGNKFAFNNEKLKIFKAPKLEKIGEKFLYNNKDMLEINLPNVKEISNSFMYENEFLKVFDAPSLEKIEDNFLYNNKEIEEMNLSKVKEIFNDFMYTNEKLKVFDAPSLEKIGNNFLMYNKNIEEIFLSSVRKIGNTFMTNNKKLRKFVAPKLELIGDCFLLYNKDIEEMILPKVKEIGFGFMSDNKIMKSFIAPVLEKVKNGFLLRNTEIEELYLLSLKYIGDSFVTNNKKIKIFMAPNLIEECESKLGYRLLELLYDNNINQNQEGTSRR